ncbi:hypothetical protein SLE2022_196260 [Rubroshorea leprosula]
MGGDHRHASSSSNSPETVLPLAVVPGDFEEADVAPIISSYNDHIRPLLDAIDRLRLLQVMKEGIQLPTIVVVGDQSSGKSSVLESLAGIHLPRGQGICTRVPLIMRLQNQDTAEPELFLEYSEKTVPVEEDQIADAISLATDEIAGSGKGISNTPLTLVVKKNGVPDLTMVDLPGITRVPVHGQPENIYEQVTEMIMGYIKPEESIILNVLSATVDFSTCESIRMSQQVDRNGQRTLAVVTKADKSPEGLREKVSSNDVNIGLGYVCVRNRVGDESFEEARGEEENLFETHPLLSKMDKSIVGIPVLAEKLVQVQANIISKCLPKIVMNINEKLSANVMELEKMPKILSSHAEAMTTFMQIIGSAKESLRKILLRGEFDEYPDDKEMHGSARLVEMLDKFANELHKSVENEQTGDFLIEEIKVLEEAKGIELPNFLSHSAFLCILQRKVDRISSMPTDCVEQTWGYIERVVIAILKRHSEDYPQLKLATTRAAKSLISKMKEQSMNRVMEIVQMERLTDYTCNPDYLSEWSKLLSQQQKFMGDLTSFNGYNYNYNSTTIEGWGTIQIEHLRGKSDTILQQAFDLKTRMKAYWKIVLRRLVDTMALLLKFNVHNLVTKEMEKEIFMELLGADGGKSIERILEESPGIAGKRERLKSSIGMLRESKEVVAQMMDKIGSYGD